MIVDDVREIEKQRRLGCTCIVTVVEDHEKEGISLQRGAEGSVAYATFDQHAGTFGVLVMWVPTRGAVSYLGTRSLPISDIEIKEYVPPKDPAQKDLFLS